MRRSIPFSGPFTTAEAYAAGLTSGILRGPSVRRLFAGVYLTTEMEVSEEVLVAAALKVVRQAVVVGVTALHLHGIDIGPPAPLYLVSTNPHPVRRAGLNVARVGVLPPHSGSVATAEHAFVSAATYLDLLELVMAGDWLLRNNGCRLPALQAYASNFTGRGAVAARRAAGLVRTRVDSPRETMLRLCLVLAGLPTPDCNLLMGTHDHPIGRIDLVFKKFGVLVEYEGDQHRTDRWQWNVDIGRYEEFTADGYLVIRVTGAAMRRAREVVCRVHSALRSRGYRARIPASHLSGVPSSSRRRVCADRGEIRHAARLGDDQRTVARPIAPNPRAASSRGPDISRRTCPGRRRIARSSRLRLAARDAARRSSRR